MKLKNCIRCGRVFAYIGNSLCPDCIQQDEEEFILVKEYIYEHPKARLHVIEQETGVSQAKILRFVREGRLEAEGNEDLLVTCERCHTPISEGRFCLNCINDLTKGMVGKDKDSLEEEDKHRTGKMHISENLDRKHKD